MKTLRHVMLGLGIVALCASGCAERPGTKKDDKKADKNEKNDKDKTKADAKKD